MTKIKRYNSPLVTPKSTEFSTHDMDTCLEIFGEDVTGNDFIDFNNAWLDGDNDLLMDRQTEEFIIKQVFPDVKQWKEGDSCPLFMDILSPPMSPSSLTNESIDVIKDLDVHGFSSIIEFDETNSKILNKLSSYPNSPQSIQSNCSSSFDDDFETLNRLDDLLLGSKKVADFGVNEDDDSNDKDLLMSSSIFTSNYGDIANDGEKMKADGDVVSTCDDDVLMFTQLSDRSQNGETDLISKNIVTPQNITSPPTSIPIVSPLHHNKNSIKLCSIFGGKNGASDIGTEKEGDKTTTKVTETHNSFYVESNEERKQQVLNHCNICTLTFSNESELTHHHSQFMSKIMCCQCGRTFVSVSKLQRHTTKHSKSKSFRCLPCGKFFAQKTTLTRHQNRYCKFASKASSHSAISSQLSTSNEFKLFNISSDTLEDTAFSLFPDSFESLDPLPICDNWNTSSLSLLSAIPTSSKDLKSVTSSHESEHVTCKVCWLNFPSSQAMAQHEDHFSDNKTCCACSKILGNKSKLIAHHRTHTKEQPFDCSFCSKRFSDLSTLRKHESTHGAKNYVCDICDRAFVRKDYLKKHTVRAHRQTFSCAKCHKFTCHDQKVMTQHMQSMNCC